MQAHNRWRNGGPSSIEGAALRACGVLQVIRVAMLIVGRAGMPCPAMGTTRCRKPARTATDATVEIKLNRCRRRRAEPHLEPRERVAPLRRHGALWPHAKATAAEAGAGLSKAAGALEGGRGDGVGRSPNWRRPDYPRQRGGRLRRLAEAARASSLSS